MQGVIDDLLRERSQWMGGRHAGPAGVTEVCSHGFGDDCGHSFSGGGVECGLSCSRCPRPPIASCHCDRCACPGLQANTRLGSGVGC